MVAKDTNTVIARIGLDDRGFQEGVSKIQRSLKVVQSEFAAASSKLGDFGNVAEGLKLKADSLNKQMELQKNKVAAYIDSGGDNIEFGIYHLAQSKPCGAHTKLAQPVEKTDANTMKIQYTFEIDLIDFAFDFY